MLRSRSVLRPSTRADRRCAVARGLRAALLAAGLALPAGGAAQATTAPATTAPATTAPATTAHGTTAHATTARGVRSAPPVLTIEAYDFAFRAPATVPAGVTTVRFVNRGTQMHHVQFNRLADGHTLADMLRDWAPGRANPAYMSGAGGPTAALAGQTLTGTVLLEPGRYALICWVPAPDGQLHVHKGMMAVLEVAGPAAPVPPPLPRADVTVTLFDYGFLVPTLTPGRRVVRVFNAGPQAHEVVMVRLAPGRTASDAAAWAERGQTGDAPGTMVGGVAALTPGGVAQFALDVEPGEYAMLCFVPDQRDGRGRSHVAHGMLRQFTVR